MKKLIYSFALMLVMAISANNVSAADKVKDKIELTAEQKVKIERISNRVEEIRHMDKSSLTRTERKELRKELKELKAEANATAGGGVYLSVGAIIIIILLLILIL